MLLKMNTYRRDETKHMSFWIKNEELLEKHNEIWDNLRNAIKKDLIENLFTMKNI